MLPPLEARFAAVDESAQLSEYLVPLAQVHAGRRVAHGRPALHSNPNSKGN